MAKNRLRILLGSLLAGGLIGCASPTPYVMTLKDGRRVSANGFPQLNETTGFYRLEDPSGKAHLFPEKEVASIEPVQR